MGLHNDPELRAADDAIVDSAIAANEAAQMIANKVEANGFEDHNGQLYSAGQMPHMGAMFDSLAADNLVWSKPDEYDAIDDQSLLNLQNQLLSVREAVSNQDPDHSVIGNIDTLINALADLQSADTILENGLGGRRGFTQGERDNVLEKTGEVNQAISNLYDQI